MSPASEGTERGRRLSLDEFFDAMADRHRRYVLYSLRDASDGVISFDDVATFVLVHDPDLTERATVETILHHSVLPKLGDIGLVEYDSRTETIRYRGSHWFDDCVAHSAWIERQ